VADQTSMTEGVDRRARQGARGLPRAVGARRGGLAMAGVLAATGLFFGFQALMLDLGHVGLPGPGFFPLALGLLLVAFSIAIGIGCSLAASKEESIEFGHPHVLIALAALLAVPLLFEPLGGYATLGLLGAVLLIFIARVSPVFAIVWCVLGMAASWYLFQELLGVRLPMGPF